MFKYKFSHGYLPCRGNSLVIVKTPLEHKVNPVLSPIMPRMSIQIFMR
jgi:Rps23 Pro-64 3,4-dihydroxylase Tpa1-like proline 4-hydroxylase